MKKRFVDGVSGGPYWVWEMPEIAAEIPELLKAAGTARVIRQAGTSVTVEVELTRPLLAIDWTKSKSDGIAINAATFHCFAPQGPAPSMRIHRLPTTGDTTVTLTIRLEMHASQESESFTLDDLRQALRDTAEKMTHAWCYHYSEATRK